MTQHAELIRRLETNAALMPSDAAVALEYKAAAEALKEQAVEIERLRKDAALVAARERERMEKDAGRYQFLRDCDLDDMAAKYWPGGQVPTGEEFDAAIDAAIRALNTEGDGHDR